MKRASVAAVALAIGLWLAASPAGATYHIMVIDQVFFGFEQAPGAQYVMLREQAGLQNSVYGQPVPIFDASGDPAGSFATFCSMPKAACILPTVSPACKAPNTCLSGLQTNGQRILIATRWAQDLFCVTADLLAAEPTLPYPDGRVCFGDCAVQPQPGMCATGPVDCVAYGDFPAASNGIFGTPAVSPMPGEALVGSPDRQNQFIGGNLLGSSVGFSVGAPTPQNFHKDTGMLDGLPGDPDGTGVITADNLAAEVHVLFEADRRCALADPGRRGADANLDTLINAADVVATVRIVAAG